MHVPVKVIMKAISDMRDEFLANFAGVLTAIQGIKRDFSKFLTRLEETEQLIEDTEDNITTLQKTVAMLQKHVTSLTAKTKDQDNRIPREQSSSHQPAGGNREMRCSSFSKEMASRGTGC